MPTHSLHINKLRIPVFIGIKIKERTRIQLVEIDLTLTFATPPKGCVSDRLEDALCYAGLVDQIVSMTRRKHYCLIEHLSHDIYKSLNEQLGTKAKVAIKTTKLTPPVPNIFGGVTYQIQDT